jgi:restriction endonuclease S subunit
MAQISEITIEDLGLDTRLDAEHYQPFYLKSVEAIKLVGGDILKNLGKFIIGPFGSTVKIEDYIPYSNSRYIRGKDVKNFFIDDSDNAYISDEKYAILKNFHIKNNDLLITVVGTLGNVSVTTEDIGNAIFSCKSTILRPTHILPGYLCIFLNTKHGQGLLIRNERGAVQTGFNLRDLENILIPRFGEEFEVKINNSYFRAYELRQRSKFLYRQAEQLLLQELRLEDFNVKWIAGYETDINTILEVARMDAEYFQPRYEIVKDKIRAVDHNTLGNLVKPLKKGIEVGTEAYTDEGIPFLRVSNIEKLRIDNSSEQYINEELYEELKDKFCPKKGEILLSKDGTPGIAYHLTEDVKTIISGGIVRLKTIEIEPEYLTLVLNSLIVQAQIEQDAGGALIKHWQPDQIKTTLIPILPKAVREKIVSMVQESFSALHESRQLLEAAINEVEKNIEH